MKFNRTFVLFCLVVASILTNGQELTQSVKGRITDLASGAPVSNASIVISKDEKTYSGQANDNGNYSVNVPIGRYKIVASLTGYEPQQQELLVISARQTVMNFSLEQKSQLLKEVEVNASTLEDDVPGLHSLTIEKTLRVPANFFDPVRVATAYPGVIAANDQNNSIIVRGNSPSGLLWRLNGLDIVNPNHLANAGTLNDKPAANGGGVNILSAQMLDRTDFYMGAFPSRYGNALAGIIDMRLREGNKSKFEYTAQASLIGMDVAAEGPIGKKQNTSFLANYRYSTVGLLSKMGVNFGDEAITFQDFSFNLDKNLAKGKLSLFGMFGNSTNKFKHKEQKDWKEDKDRYDIDYSSNTIATGFNYSTSAFSTGKFSIGLAYSRSNQERTQALGYVQGPLEHFPSYDFNKFDHSIISNLIKLEGRAGQNSTWEVGMLTNLQQDDLADGYTLGSPPEISHSINGFVFQPFVNWNLAVSKSFIARAGLHYINYTFNNTGQLEPRVQLTFVPSQSSSIDLSYDLVGQLQQPQVYENNYGKDLDLTKAHHFNLNYNNQINESLKLKTGVFYQQIYDVPVSIPSIITEPFSALNSIEPPLFGSVANNGKGKNYGVDATIEKKFFGNHYFMVGGSYYESKYTDYEGVEHDTRFNGKYTFTSVYGKEWTKLSRNRTIGLSSRLLYLGGLRVTSIDEPLSRSFNTTVYDYSNPYNEKLKDYFRLDLRLSFRKNKPKYTRTFAIDIQNLTSQQNEAYRYYDAVQQKIVTKFQLGIIPILVYRIDF
jgi:hypothetical protein